MVFVALLFLSSCVRMFFCWHGANKTQRPLSEFLFALFLLQMLECFCYNINNDHDGELDRVR